MDITQIQRPVAIFYKNISEKIHVEDMILFGSHARGDADEESDIDLIIVSSAFDQMEEDDRLDLLYKASVDIRPEIQPWGYTRKELDSASYLTLLGNARDNGLKLSTSEYSM